MTMHAFRWHPGSVRESLAGTDNRAAASCLCGWTNSDATLLDNVAGRRAAEAEYAQHLADELQIPKAEIVSDSAPYSIRSAVAGYSLNGVLDILLRAAAAEADAGADDDLLDEALTRTYEPSYIRAAYAKGAFDALNFVFHTGGPTAAFERLLRRGEPGEGYPEIEDDSPSPTTQKD